MAMRLDAWIRKEAAKLDSFARRTFRQKFAEEIEVTPGALSRYCQLPTAKHFRLPAHDVMLRIYLATRGQVDPNSFYDLPEMQIDLEDAIAEARAA